MLTIKHLTPEDYLPEPWKNGRGITRVIAKDSADPFRWRVTRAEISGKAIFSPYPGYDRTLVFLGDSIVGMTTAGKFRFVHPLTPYAFSGESETSADVAKPGDDFNVFVLHEHLRAGVYSSVFTEGNELQFPLPGEEHFIHCVSGETLVEDRNLGQSIHLKSQDTLWISRPDQKEYLNLRAVAKSARCTLLWTVIRPRDS